MLYLDSSALVKRYVEEEGSEAVRAAMAAESAWWICRIGFVETVRAAGLVAGDGPVRAVKREWESFGVVEVDAELTEQAATLALSTGLRSLDALHLAAALRLEDEELTFATWDTRLHAAVREQGLHALPEALA